MQNRIIGFFSIFAGVGLIYLIKNQFDQKKVELNKKVVVGQSKYLCLELTLKITQEIKYQMIIVCIQFARKVTRHLKRALNPAQLEEITSKLKINLHKFYSQKEQIILEKYQIEKQLYEQSIINFKDQTRLQKIKKDIQLMMKDAVQGNIPSLAVPQQASKHLSPKEVIEVYRQMLELIVLLVRNEVIFFIQIDQSFNAKDQQQFKKVLKKLRVYDIKSNFLMKKGYLYEWGCPNQIFLKIIKTYKDNPDLDKKISKIDKIYQQVVDKIQQDPFKLNDDDIQILFAQSFSQQR